LSPERKLWLWDGSSDVKDIGYNIQDRLSAIADANLFNVELHFWTGEGFDWLLINLTDRIQILDMETKTDLSPDGAWFSIIPSSSYPTAFCTYNVGKVYLLTGLNDGSVIQVGDVCQPAHLGLSFNLGGVYLGSTVQNSPNCTIRTGPIAKDGFSEAKYLTYYHIGDTNTSSITAANPTVNAYYDEVNPYSPQTAVALTSATISQSNERRAWFKKTASDSSTGALCKSVQVELKRTSTDTDNASRPQLVNNEFFRLSVVTQPRKSL
jgi:hypothetical protein